MLSLASSSAGEEERTEAGNPHAALRHRQEADRARADHRESCRVLFLPLLFGVGAEGHTGGVLQCATSGLSGDQLTAGEASAQ